MQLYRLEGFDYFLTMLTAREVSFRHPSKWPDPYEWAFLTAGHTVEHALVQGDDGRYYGSLPRKAGSATAHITYTNPYGGFVFAQCFGREPQESEWGWAAGNGEKVRWSIDSDRYIAALRNSSPTLEVTLVPKVEYLPDAELKSIQQDFVAKYGRGGRSTTFWQWSKDVVDILSKKRAAGFLDQHESRVVVIDTDYYRKLEATRTPPPPPMPAKRDHLSVSLRLADFLTDVMLSPTTAEAASAAREMRIRSAGFHGPVSRSELYSAPVLGTRAVKPFS